MRRSLMLSAGLIAGLAGCSPEIFLNTEFLASLGFGQGAATLPGESPEVLVQVENRTDRTVEALLTVRTGEDDVAQRALTIPPGLPALGEAFFCPVSQLTLGDVANPNSVGAVVRLGNGGANDPVIEVEPFGVILESGINYDCGDSILFAVIPSAESVSGYQIFAFVRRSGSQTATQVGN
jgi:hypothetical protein